MHILKTVFILILLFPVGFAEAGTGLTYTVFSNSSNSSNNDQILINEATLAAYEAGGGEVHLVGLFLVSDAVRVGSNTNLTGEAGTEIKVADTSKQFFGDGTGIVDQIDSVPSNITVSDIYINGNLHNLPTSFADTPPGDHNAHRAIDFRGTSTNFMKNIVIHNVTVKDCYSDGIHIVFADGVKIFNNILINCQHDGINVVNILNGIIQFNYVEAITSDGIRADNSPYCEISFNNITSFTGDSNGAYKGGANGIQVGDQGVSHGGGSPKPNTTENVSVFGNVINNIKLEAIKLYTDAKNVIIGENNIDNDTEETVDVVVMDQPVNNTTENVIETPERVITVTGNDDNAINQAIEEAVSKNVPVVILPARKYIISNQIKVKEGITLQGETPVNGEWKSLLFLVDNAKFERQVPIILMESNTELLYLWCDGNYKNQGNAGSNNEGMGNGFFNWVGSFYAENIEISSCKFDNNNNDLMRHRSAVNIQIHDNEFSRAGHEAIFLIQCENAEVYNNYIQLRDNCGVRLIGGWGIRIYNNLIDFQRYDVEGLFTTAAHAFQIQNDDGKMGDIEINNNRLTNSPVSAFWIVSKLVSNIDDLWIHHNVITNAGNGKGWGNAGIISTGYDNVVIENNVFDGTKGPCIEYEGFGGAWENQARATIRNNVFVDSEGRCVENKISEQTGTIENNCAYNSQAGSVPGFSSVGDYFTNPRTDQTLCEIKWDGTQWVIPGIVPKKLSDVEHIYKDVDPITDEEIDEFDNIFDMLRADFRTHAGENDTVILPEGVTDGPTESTGTVKQYGHGNSSYTLVYVPVDGLTRVSYEVGGKEAIHTIMLGERRGSTLIFSKCSIWSGDFDRIGDTLYLDGIVEPDSIEVICYTAKGSFHPDLEVIKIEQKSNGLFNNFILFYLAILGVFLSIPFIVIAIVFSKRF